MQKGNIGVSSENIFPVIKKFLYSEHEIFLRELISNATDAVSKLKVLANTGEFKGNIENLQIRVSIDKDKGTLTVSDSGLGMTEDEVTRYINQIAFSSAGEFLDKYKDSASSIIGHFGLGFYSAFMVSERVEIVTKSWQENAEAVSWSCTGSPEYEMKKVEKDTVGTDVILYLDKDSKEFLEEDRIEGILTKFCRFLPVPIAFGEEKEWKDGKMVETGKEKIINNPNPLWKKKPADINEEEYKAFYHELYPGSYEEPLFNIHLNVDYPFNLTGILYFPKIKDRFELQKNKIQLYCNQVFVTDSVENIVPDYLMLLHGVIDSPDIPLNVSRSYLQGDPNVKKISSHITKKVADKLQEIFKTNRDEFEKKWSDLRVFIQYGIISDEKFAEKADKFFMFTNIEDKNFTLEEYEKLVKENQTDKDKKTIYLYTSDTDEQFTFIKNAQDKGYDVLKMNGFLDSHYINYFEEKNKDIRFSRVDSDTIDNLIRKEDKASVSLSEIERDRLKIAFNKVLPTDKQFFLTFEENGEKELPVTITKSEFTRRMKDMAAVGGGPSFYKDLPDNFSFVINSSHPLIKELNSKIHQSLGEDLTKLEIDEEKIKKASAKIEEEERKASKDGLPEDKKAELDEMRSNLQEIEKKKEGMMEGFSQEAKVLNQLTDIAFLAHGMLKGEALNNFVKRSVDLIDIDTTIQKAKKKKASAKDKAKD
ncbi:MAG: molecular chaperone HtpG [Bacteroidetes bacterium HGW-Bacteroidetes-21]|jgi:molecular chaperone HtpG|nr:MAG: molecular chaperone HtpG [Bacteroidetes bacterium HGW-Bacteroidetes-21]